MTPRLAFVPPRVDEDEWERAEVGEVHFKPLTWVRTPPDRPGYFWVRRMGGTEQIVLRVGAGDEYAVGDLEWSSAPVPCPYERRSR